MNDGATVLSSIDCVFKPVF